MTKLIILVLIALQTTSAFGQWTTNVLQLYKKDAELTFGFNNRRTHINNEFGTIYGFKIGLNFDRRLKNTFVFSSTIFDLGEPENKGESFTTAQLHFASIAEELTFYKRKNLGFVTYFTFGYGFNFNKSFSSQNELLHIKRENILPLELGLQSSYVLFKWLELKVGAGWRYFLLGNHEGLSGYYFKVGAGIKYKAFRTAFNF